MSSQPLMSNRSLSNRSMFNRSLFNRSLFNRIRFNPRQIVRAAVFALILSLLSAASASLAYGQSFVISIPAGLNRPAVDPGGSAIATIVVTSSGTLSSPVSLSCAISSGPVSTSPPVCGPPSPASVIPPGSASLTITTSDTTAVGLYNFTVTGTSGSLAPQTLSLSLTVEPLSEDYTLSVTPTTAVPNPVPAGGAATTTVSISPIGSYSGHQITLACLSVTPVVTAGPVCSFQPTNGSGPGPVHVTAGTPATATLTITTYGPIPTTRLGSRRIYYAFWLALPGLALMVLSTTGTYRKSALGVLFLLLLAGGVLLMPACGSSAHTNSPNGEITPNNTYTFTITGADENGAAPSNVTTDEATVSITVN